MVKRVTAGSRLSMKFLSKMFRVRRKCCERRSGASPLLQQAARIVGVLVESIILIDGTSIILIALRNLVKVTGRSILADELGQCDCAWDSTHARHPDNLSTTMISE